MKYGKIEVANQGKEIRGTKFPSFSYHFFCLKVGISYVVVDYHQIPVEILNQSQWRNYV